MDKYFNRAPLLPQNTVDIDLIQGQQFYCEKCNTYGSWLCKDGKIATVFCYQNRQFVLPFRAIFKPKLLYWLKESAILQLEDAIEEQMMAESGLQEW